MDGEGRFKTCPYGARQLMGDDGEGQRQGLPLRGTDGGGSSRTRSSVWAGGSRTVPTGRVGWMGMTGGGCGGCVSAQVGTMAREILCGTNGGEDGSPHTRGQREGKGNHKGCPCGGADGGGGRRTGSSVWAGGSRTAPTVQIRRWEMKGKGNHEGCPYGGRMGRWSSNPFVSVGGRFPNRAYGAN